MEVGNTIRFDLRDHIMDGEPMTLSLCCPVCGQKIVDNTVWSERCPHTLWIHDHVGDVTETRDDFGLNLDDFDSKNEFMAAVVEKFPFAVRVGVKETYLGGDVYGQCNVIFDMRDSFGDQSIDV